MPEFRPAVTADVPQIIAILRGGFPHELLDCTIFGCGGIQRYLEDSVERQDRSGGASYVVCSRGEELLGFAEMRSHRELLFLNQIYVRPTIRGHGLGSGLLGYALAQSSPPGRPVVQLDVFLDNAAAGRWYASLGFVPQQQRVWMRAELDGSCNTGGEDWDLRGLFEADRAQAVYGFSQFDLRTPSGDYSIGRLGDRLFRSTDRRILSDPVALSALRTLDGTRELLSIDQAETATRSGPAGSVVLARSARMAADLTTVVRRLAAAAGRRQAVSADSRAQEAGRRGRHAA